MTGDLVAPGAERQVKEHQSVLAAAAATGVALIAALMLYTFEPLAGWLAVAGSVCVAIGAFFGTRGAVGAGVGVVAIASLVATSDADLGFTLVVSAIIAILCLAVLLLGDISFVMRRATLVSAATLQGFFGAHAVASVLGIGLAVLLLSAVVAVSWPGWLLLLPATLLGVASVVLARQASHYNRAVRTVPGQAAARAVPPPPGRRGNGPPPPPPAPGSQTTRRIPPPPPANQRPFG